MDVLQAPQDLVQEVTDMVVAEPLVLQQFVEVSFHKSLYNVPV